MTGVLALGQLEIRRALRNRRIMFFTILYPVMLFLLSAGSAKGKRNPGKMLNYATLRGSKNRCRNKSDHPPDIHRLFGSLFHIIRFFRHSYLKIVRGP